MGKELPFIGFTFSKTYSKHKKDTTVVKNGISTENCLDIDTSINTKQRRQSTSVDVTLTVKIAEIKKLREKCNDLEESECSLKVYVFLIRLISAFVLRCYFFFICFIALGNFLTWAVVFSWQFVFMTN